MLFRNRKPRVELNDDFNALVATLDERFATIARLNATIADTLTTVQSVFAAILERETDSAMRARIEEVIGDLDVLRAGCGLMAVGLDDNAAVIAKQKQQLAG